MGDVHEKERPRLLSFAENHPIHSAGGHAVQVLRTSLTSAALRGLAVRTLPDPREWPVLGWLRTYTVATLRSDTMAALLVAAMLVPQGLAYALLAGLDPVYGLYSAIFPALAYALFTTTPFMSPGPNAPSAVLMANMVSALTTAAPRSAEFTRVTVALGFVAGVMALAGAMLRVSAVSRALSWPVIHGFTAGAGSVILLSQIAPLLGLRVPRAEEFFPKLVATFSALPTTHWPTALLGLACVLVLATWKRVRIYERALPPWMPMQLLIVVFTTVISWSANLPRAGVSVVGAVPSNLPAPSVPPLAGWAEFVSLVPTATVLAVINYIQTQSVASSLGRQSGGSPSASAELLALGVSGILGAHFSCHAISGGFTRSVLQQQSGARTPATIIFTALLVLLVVSTASASFTFLPMTALAAIIAVSALQLFDIEAWRRMWRGSLGDLAQSVATFAGVLALGIDKGVLVGIGISLALLLWRSFNPRMTESGILPGTDVWVALARYPQAEVLPSIPVYRVDGELHFGNIQGVVDALEARLRHGAAEASNSHGMHTNVATIASSVALQELSTRSETRSVYAAAACGSVDAEQHGRPGPGERAVLPTAARAAATDVPLHGIVLDCSRVVSVDGSACQELAALLKRCTVPVVCAALPGPTRDTMVRYGIDARSITSLSITAAALAIVDSSHGATSNAEACASGGTAPAAATAAPDPQPSAV